MFDYTTNIIEDISLFKYKKKSAIELTPFGTLHLKILKNKTTNRL